MKDPTCFDEGANIKSFDDLISARRDTFLMFDAIENSTTGAELAANLNALPSSFVIHDWTVDRETDKYVRLKGSNHKKIETYYLRCDKEQPATPIMQSTVSTLPTFVQVPRYNGIIRDGDDKIVFEQVGKPAFINVNFVASILPYTSRNYKVPDGYFTIRMNDGMTYETDQAAADFILSLC